MHPFVCFPTDAQCVTICLLLIYVSPSPADHYRPPKTDSPALIRPLPAAHTPSTPFILIRSLT